MDRLLRVVFTVVLIVGILESIFGTTYTVTTRSELKSGYPENAITAVETDTSTEYGPFWGLGFKIPPPTLTYTVDYRGNWLGVLLAILGGIGLMLSKKRMRKPPRIAIVALVVGVCVVSVASIPYLKRPGTVIQGSSTISPVHTATQSVISEWQALRVAFGSSRNFTTLPPPYSPGTTANLTATLELVVFYASPPVNSTSGGFDATIIPVDNQTGLPTKTLAAYPNAPFEFNGRCVQYMYVWAIQQFPAPYPRGGSINIDAVTGQIIGDLRGISFGLTCAIVPPNPPLQNWRPLIWEEANHATVNIGHRIPQLERAA